MIAIENLLEFSTSMLIATGIVRFLGDFSRIVKRFSYKVLLDI